MHAMRAFVVVVLGVVALGGCEAYKQQSKAKQLELQSRAYVKAVRWSKFADATGFLRRRNSGMPPPDLSLYRGIRVTNSEMTVSADGADALEAQMIAVFDYYRDDAPSIRTVTQAATWWYDPLDQAWYLDSGLPEF